VKPQRMPTAWPVAASLASQLLHSDSQLPPDPGAQTRHCERGGGVSGQISGVDEGTHTHTPQAQNLCVV